MESGSADYCTFRFYSEKNKCLQHPNTFFPIQVEIFIPTYFANPGNRPSSISNAVLMETVSGLSNDRAVGKFDPRPVSKHNLQPS